MCLTSNNVGCRIVKRIFRVSAPLKAPLNEKLLKIWNIQNIHIAGGIFLFLICKLLGLKSFIINWLHPSPLCKWYKLAKKKAASALHIYRLFVEFIWRNVIASKKQKKCFDWWLQPWAMLIFGFEIGIFFKLKNNIGWFYSDEV